MTKAMRVGFVGLGAMGHGMAKNILEHGFPLTVIAHRNRRPIEDLIARGAREATSLAALAQSSDVVLLCVTGSPEVEEVVFKEGGLLSGLQPGAVVIDTTTANPVSTRKVAEAVEAKGGRFLDAPLSRTPKEAEAGCLNIMVGGDAAVLAEVRPVLDAFTENIEHVGPVGAGHQAKLLHQIVVLGNAVLVAEALACAAKVGVDAAALCRIWETGGAGSTALRRMLPWILGEDDSGFGAPISNARKDVGYYCAMASDAGMASFAAETVHQVYALAANTGHADRQIPRLVDALRALNGLES